MKTETLESYKPLVEKVAEHLSGRPVIVRWQVPAVTGAAGSAMKSHDVGVIDIDPTESQRRQFYILLHECVHLKSDWDLLPDNASAPSQSIPFTPEMHAEDRATPTEHRARKWGHEWANFADYHRFSWTKTYPGQIIPRLAALLTWKSEN